jgi:hypothetical protein
VDSRISRGSAAATGTVMLDRSRATEARNDPTIPWLTVVLLMIAGVSVVQTLRLRPGFGAYLPSVPNHYLSHLPLLRAEVRVRPELA